MFRSAPRLLFMVLGLFSSAALVVYTYNFDAVVHTVTQAALLGCESPPEQASGPHCESVARALHGIIEGFPETSALPVNTIVLMSIIIFFSSIAEAGFGFGGGLLAIPLLSLVIDLHTSITLFLVFQTLKGTLLFIGFRWIAWAKIWLVTLVLPLASWLGLSSLDYFDSRFIGIVLGAYLIGYVLTQYIPTGYLRSPSLNLPLVQIATGILSGFVQGLIGGGGPLLVTYLKACNLQPNPFRFSVIFLLFVANFFRITLAVNYGMVNYQIYNLILACLPAYGSALVIGYKLPKLLSHAQFSVIINILLIVSAASLLVKNLL
jgi:uncharacterized protein